MLKRIEAVVGAVVEAKVENDGWVRVEIELVKDGVYRLRRLDGGRPVRFKIDHLAKLRAARPAPATISVVVEEPQVTTTTHTAASEPKFDIVAQAVSSLASRRIPTGEKKIGCLSAAAMVLSSVGQPMNVKEMIEAMTTSGLWSSPGGKTPHATLYSAIIREIADKGRDSRFVKTSRGMFAHCGNVN